MNSPVLQALLNARLGKRCITKGVRALPAAPIHVAAFIRDCEPVAPIEKIWEAVHEVSQSHLSNGFADPTAGGVVAETMNSIAKIAPPRWPKDLLPRFSDLPYDVQRYLASRDKEQERVVRRAQEEAAKARKALAAIQQPEATDGTQQNAAA
jgi:hypothetical protein